MEKEFKIPIPNTDLSIYANQRGSLDRPVILFVHGLTGHINEHIFYNGSHYFDDHEFSSVRFSLYGGEADARTRRTGKT